MDYDNNNIFAQILNGSLPAEKVYEDDNTLAFMDIMPQVDGHTLVIPKAPAVDLLTSSAGALQHTIVTTQRIARAVKQAFSAAGVMVMQLNGSAAGQTVFHLHFHVLPRHSGIDLRLHGREQAAPEVLAEHARRIRAVLT